MIRVGRVGDDVPFLPAPSKLFDYLTLLASSVLLPKPSRLLPAFKETSLWPHARRFGISESLAGLQKTSEVRLVGRMISKSEFTNGDFVY